MAGIFDTSDLGAGAGRSTVVAPVAAAQKSRPVAPGPSGLTSALGAFAGLTAGAGAQFAALKKSKATAARTAVLKEYTGAMDSLDQALEGGESSSTVMSTRRRVNSKFLADHPELAKEFNSLQTSLATTNVGDALGDEQAELEAFRKVKSDAVKANFIRPGMSDAQEKAQTALFQESQEAEVALNKALKLSAEARAVRGAQRAETSLGLAVQSNTRANQTHALNFAQVQNALDEKTITTKMTQALGAYAAANTMNIAGEMQEIASNPDLNTEEKERLMNNKLLEVRTFLTQAAGADGQKLSDAYYAPFEQAHKIAQSLMTGKVTAEVAQNQLVAIKAQTQVNMLDEPGVKEAVAVSDLFKNNPAVTAQVTEVTAGMVKSLLEPNSDGGSVSHPSIMTGSDDVRSFAVETAIASIDNIETSENPEAAKAETRTILSNIMQGMEGRGHTAYAQKPKAWKASMDLFGSDAFGKAMQNGLVSKQMAGDVSDMISGTYTSIVEKTITNTFGKDASGVSVEWNGAGVVFKPVAIKPTGGGAALAKGFERVAQGQMTARRRAKTEEMRTAGSVLNKLIRAGANLQGISPQKYFELNKEAMLPLWFKAEETKGDD